MPKPIPTPFTAYEFSEAEKFEAKLFSPMQTMYLNTELAIIATERISLMVNTENLERTKAELEYTRGKMEQLQYLLGISNELYNELTQRNGG